MPLPVWNAAEATRTRSPPTGSWSPGGRTDHKDSLTNGAFQGTGSARWSGSSQRRQPLRRAARRPVRLMRKKEKQRPRPSRLQGKRLRSVTRRSGGGGHRGTPGRGAGVCRASPAPQPVPRAPSPQPAPAPPARGPSRPATSRNRTRGPAGSGEASFGAVGGLPPRRPEPARPGPETPARELVPPAAPEGPARAARRAAGGGVAPRGGQRRRPGGGARVAMAMRCGGSSGAGRGRGAHGAERGTRGPTRPGGGDRRRRPSGRRVGEGRSPR